MHRLRTKAGLWFSVCAIAMALASFSAFAGMIALDEDILSDTRARTGVTIDIPSARATATAMYLRDSNGATGKVIPGGYGSGLNNNDTDPGSLVLMNVALTDTPAAGFAGAGNIQLNGYVLDLGRSGSTSYMVLQLPDIVGRISIENVRASEDAGANTTALGYGIWVQNISFDTGSALWLWGH